MQPLIVYRCATKNWKPVEQAIARAIAFLERSQLVHGEFTTYAASDESLTTDCCADSSPFVTSLILYSLSYVQAQPVQAMLTRGLAFLCAEMEAGGVWRYWSSHNQHHHVLPPDLDDIACISFVLARHNTDFPSNQALILANRNAAGLFYTWLAVRADTPPTLAKVIRRVVKSKSAIVLSLSGTLDLIDGGVNANVLLYLGECAATRPAIDFLIQTILEEKEDSCSSYYLDRLTLYYLLSRAYLHSVRALEPMRMPIIARISAMQAHNGSFGSALRTAFAACTLLNFECSGPVLDRAIQALLRLQNHDGSWQRMAMFLGPAPYYGSEELTSAFCLEALARYHVRH